MMLSKPNVFRFRLDRLNIRKTTYFYAKLIIGVLISLLILTPLFPQTAQAIAAPDPLLPAYGATITATGYDGSSPHPPVAIPEFSWTPVAGATRYRLQLSQNIGFNPPVYDYTTPLTSYIPISASQLNDGLWYWQVRVDASPEGVSDYSPIFQFTKQWATLDNKPNLISPLNGASIDFYDAPTFSWQPVLGAANYRFEIAASQDGFVSPVYQQTTLAFSHQPLLKLANGTAYWRVVPLDPAGRTGVPSDARQINLAYGSTGSFPGEIPTLLEPQDMSNPTFTPTFRWTAVRGAQYYDLSYTTDPTCNFGAAGFTTTVPTNNTSYTPINDFPNDMNYCWRVRARSGASIGDWSATWEFVKQWYIQPLLLTPTNNSQHVKYPFFSWTPVPGAANYKIEVGPTPSFPPVGEGNFTAYAVNPYFVKVNQDWSTSSTWYWRVTPYDQSNNAGRPSVSKSFVADYASLVPHQLYPLYYYQPNSFPPPNAGLAMEPHEDRTVPLPVFMWHRVMDLSGNEAAAYRIQVDDSPSFSFVDWDFKTENLNATPSEANPFIPQPDTVYYWRVCTLASLDASACLSPWSQVWPVRIDPSQVLPATPQISLLRPQHGSETVETMPLLEWWPLQGADSYDVEISQDPSFGSSADSATVAYPVYSPQTSLARRSLGMGHLGYGTYYWRVRGFSGGLPIGDWSDAWRFQLASQSQWRASRTLGSVDNQLLVASDLDDIVDNNYELTTFYASQDKDYWYFGFNATTGADMSYGLYLDLDHTEGSGASTDAEGFNVATIPAHQPEYAIYFLKRGGSFSADQVMIYHSAGAVWVADDTRSLSAVGGALSFAGNYLEIKVPNTAIGMEEETGRVSLALFSVDEANGNVQDTVPTSTNTTNLDRFTSVSERLNLRMPPSNATGDPRKFTSVPPFFFDYPVNTPWEGFNIKITLDPGFTTWVRDYILTSNAPYFAPPFYVEQTKVQDINGDNTYYWRVRPQYTYATNISGAWSHAGRFERQGFVPQNLSESVNFATPTFTWSMVEGAEGYDLQVDNDPNFGSTSISATTSRNLYTPTGTLAGGNYYWRVRVRRNSGTTNDWSEPKSFSLTLPAPTNLTTNGLSGEHVVPYAPTFCWDPLLRFSNDEAVLAAYKYKVQVSRGDPSFSSIYDTVDTEQSCWTPTKGYDDGTYHWRVAMFDANNHLGPYSPPAVFTKQYPTVTLISPLSQMVQQTPTFVWTSVYGAASYKLEVSINGTFTPLYDSATTNTIQYRPIKLYGSNVTYYWRVAIIDKDGKIGPFTGSTIILDPRPNKVYIPTVIR